MIQLKLNKELKNYIHSVLNSGNSLAQNLSATNLDDGLLFVTLPEGTNLLNVDDFSQGGMTSKTEADIATVNFLENCFQEHPECLVVFEAIERVGDPIIDKIDADYFSYKNEIYYFVAGKNLSPKRLLAALQLARSYPFIGILVPFPRDKLHGLNLSGEEIAQIAMGTQILLLGIFDDEAKLIWRKCSSE